MPDHEPGRLVEGYTQVIRQRRISAAPAIGSAERRLRPPLPTFRCNAANRRLGPGAAIAPGNVALAVSGAHR
jgi:hypothetical protein